MSWILIMLTDHTAGLISLQKGPLLQLHIPSVWLKFGDTEEVGTQTKSCLFFFCLFVFLGCY